jgi:hypothetical protein
MICANCKKQTRAKARFWLYLFFHSRGLAPVEKSRAVKLPVCVPCVRGIEKGHFPRRALLPALRGVIAKNRDLFCREALQRPREAQNGG